MAFFELPDILKVERAGRAMAYCTRSPVEAGVSKCLSGAAALAAIRHIANFGIATRVVLTEDTEGADPCFNINYRVLEKMGVALEVNPNDDDEYPSVISGTDSSATMGSSNFHVAGQYLKETHTYFWDKWEIDDNRFLEMAECEKAVSLLEMWNIESRAIDTFGLPGICLMENAGIGAAVIAADLFYKSRTLGEVVVLAGPGNNGGDAFVVARGLLEKGLPVRVVPLASEYSGEAEENYAILRQQPQFIHACDDLEELKHILSSARLIIDGIFGIGLNREVSGRYAEIIDLVNMSEASVLSLDIPSGLNADSGEILGECVKAGQTVTFHAPKKGMFECNGPEVCGKIHVASIGAPLTGSESK